MTDPSSTSLHKRLFAWAMSRSGTSYEAANEARKRALFGSLHGAILEIGPGAGSNLRFFPPDTQWTGVEPNPYMHAYLMKTITDLGRPMERYRIDLGDPRGVRLPAADASMDAVVSTLVMCSLPHPEESLQEILRVLKPGGRFAFIEHVAAPPGTRRRKARISSSPSGPGSATAAAPTGKPGAPSREPALRAWNWSITSRTAAVSPARTSPGRQ